MRTKNVLPSKELMTAVLGMYIGDEPKINEIVQNKIDFKSIHSPIGGVFRSINIHDFVHECKEWAYKIQKGNTGKWLNAKKDPTWQHDQFCCFVNGYKHKYIRGDTEQEAIIKACEWILTQKEKNENS